MIQRKTADAATPRSQASADAASRRKDFRRYYCRECLDEIVECKGDLCPGCDAYREHTGAF